MPNYELSINNVPTYIVHLKGHSLTNSTGLQAVIQAKGRGLYDLKPNLTDLSLQQIECSVPVHYKYIIDHTNKNIYLTYSVKWEYSDGKLQQSNILFSLMSNNELSLSNSDLEIQQYSDYELIKHYQSEDADELHLLKQLKKAVNNGLSYKGFVYLSSELIAGWCHMRGLKPKVAMGVADAKQLHEAIKNSNIEE